MPDILESWLKSLTADQANGVAQWLDEDPSAVETMIETAVDSHPSLHEEWNINPEGPDTIKP
jgi:hypothetical protein